MIPFGNIRAWQNNDNWTKFTHDEQYTLMTLWAIGRSPLIMGGNLPNNDDFTLSLMTNDEVIAVNQNSTGNRQVYNSTNHIAWVADVAGSKDKYVALFNTAPAPAPGGNRRGRGGPAAVAPPVDPAATLPALVSVPLADIGLSAPCKVRDLWTQKDLGAANGTVSAMVNSHGAVLLRVREEP
jgi:hypothetical protein